MKNFWKNNLRSTYSYEIKDNFVLITDFNFGKSVTNDMENVLKDIQSTENKDLKDYIILYRDSQGVIEQVRLGDSLEFISLNESHFVEAMKNCRYKQ